MSNPSEPKITTGRRAPIDRHPVSLSIVFVCLLLIGGFAIWTTENVQTPSSGTHATLPH